MEVDTAQSIIRAQCDAYDAAEPLRHCLETETPVLLRTIHLYVARASVAEGGDITSTALEVLSRVAIEALNAPARFDAARPPRAWLLGIAANIILRMQREHGKLHAREVPVSRRRISDDESDEDIFDRLVESAPTSPEDVAIMSEAAEALLALVSPDDQRVLWLAVVCGLDGARLSQELGISPGAARVRLARARVRLREAYHEKEVRDGHA